MIKWMVRKLNRSTTYLYVDTVNLKETYSKYLLAKVSTLH